MKYSRPFSIRRFRNESSKARSYTVARDQHTSDMGTNPDSNIEAKLREINIPHPDEKYDFTHSELIPEVLNEESVTHLIHVNGWRKPGTTKMLEYRDFNPGTPHNYITILAILVRIDCERHIGYFIEQGLSQHVLPLYGVRKGGELEFYRRDPSGNPGQLVPLACLERDINRTNFNDIQYKVMAPRFSINKGPDGSFEAKQEHFCEHTILPWHRLPGAESKQPTMVGGFSQVKRVRMDPRSHDFKKVLRQLHLPCNDFAVKTLESHDRKTDKERYKNEVRQLQNFNSFRNEHLPMLLVAFQHGNTFNFVFPFAKGNLVDFWERKPGRSKQDVLWLIRQLLGITKALSMIHNPGWLKGPKGDLFGRHGDIKPENILIFDHDIEGEIMVLSDMGLTAVHSEISRSGVNPAKIDTTLTYRPPETDYKSKGVSRAFDIWTLGCLFMEAMVWHLGGYDMLKRFYTARKSIDIRDIATSKYYDIKNVRTQFLAVTPRYTASLKKPVVEWFTEIRAHPNCTQLVQDIINLVEDEMLIVIREAKTRITTGDLLRRVSEIHDRCQDEKYWHAKITTTRAPQDILHVEVDLLDEVLNGLDSRRASAQPYQGNTERGVVYP